MKISKQHIFCYRALLVFSLVMALFLLQPILQLVSVIDGVFVEVVDFDNEGEVEEENTQENELSEEEKIVMQVQIPVFGHSLKKKLKMELLSPSFFSAISLEINAPPPDTII